MERSNAAAKLDGLVDESAPHLFRERELIRHDSISISIGGLIKEYALQHGDAIASLFHYVKKRVSNSDQSYGNIADK